MSWAKNIECNKMNRSRRRADSIPIISDWIHLFVLESGNLATTLKSICCWLRNRVEQ
jgi:hypothetical protein